jgi:ribonuclease P protein component
MVLRIRDRSTFETLRRSGRRSRRGPVTVTYAVVGGEVAPCVAYAVGRRAGGAVVRNRARRRLRAAVAGAGPALAPGSYLVSAGATAAMTAAATPGSPRP